VRKLSAALKSRREGPLAERKYRNADRSRGVATIGIISLNAHMKSLNRLRRPKAKRYVQANYKDLCLPLFDSSNDTYYEGVNAWCYSVKLGDAEEASLSNIKFN
jgi:hypothetical protein